jgi:hypothetical protein
MSSGAGELWMGNRSKFQPCRISFYWNHRDHPLNCTTISCVNRAEQYIIFSWWPAMKLHQLRSQVSQPCLLHTTLFFSLWYPTSHKANLGSQVTLLSGEQLSSHLHRLLPVVGYHRSLILPPSPRSQLSPPFFYLAKAGAE